MGIETSYGTMDIQGSGAPHAHVRELGVVEGGGPGLGQGQNEHVPVNSAQTVRSVPEINTRCWAGNSNVYISVEASCSGRSIEGVFKDARF